MSSITTTLEPTQTPYTAEEFTAFYEEMHPRALRFARVACGHKQNAEDAVAKAFLKVWELGISRRYILRVVRQVILNDRKRAAIERGIFLPLDARAGGNRPGNRTASIADTVVSSRPEDTDPLQIHIRAAEKRGAYEEVKTNSKHRWIRQLKWWNELDKQLCNASA